MSDDDNDAMAAMSAGKAKEAEAAAENKKPVLENGASPDSNVEAVLGKLRTSPQTVGALHSLGAGQPYQYYYE